MSVMSPIPSNALLIPRNGGRANVAITKQVLHALGISARRDEFGDQIILSGSVLPPIYLGSLTDNAATWIRNTILTKYGVDPGDQNMHSAIRMLAEENRFNPITEYLDALSWDGVARLAGWLPRITGAENCPLHCSAGANLILAMVVRAYHPGTKFDLCVILEGAQGAGKSSLVKALAGSDRFTDVPALLAADPKTRGELVQGMWIVELAELAGLSRTEVESVKGFLSQTHDHYRRPYGRVTIKQARSCIFVGTTNSAEYLIDGTGNRRFLPIKCGERIDLSAFIAERDQLFAEARHYAHKKWPHLLKQRGQPAQIQIGLPAKLWPEANKATEQRRLADHVEIVLEEILNRHLQKSDIKTLPNGAPFISTSELLQELRLALGHSSSAKALAGCMATLRWKKTKYGRAADQIRGYEKLQQVEAGQADA